MPALQPFATAEIAAVSERPGFATPARAIGGVDGGFGIPVGDALALYGGLGLRAHASLQSPATGLLGSVTASAQTWRLPGGMWGSLGYAYRDDFAGFGSHDLMATLERPLAGAATVFASGGYEWGGALYQGPFGALGLRLPHAPLGVTFLADIGAALQYGGTAAPDSLGAFHLGVRKALDGGYTLWARGGPELAASGQAGGTYLAPAVSAGLTWSFAAAPPRPVKNPLTVATGVSAASALAGERVVAATRSTALWTGPKAPPGTVPGEGPGGAGDPGRSAPPEPAPAGKTPAPPASPASPAEAPAQPGISVSAGGVTLGIGL